MTTHKLKGIILKKIILFLILIQTLAASPFLVKDHNFIVLEEGKLFSINGEKKKYKFESINFELELINNSIDLKYINSITFYNQGNKEQGVKFAKKTMLWCTGLGFCVIGGIGLTSEDPSELFRPLLAGPIIGIPFGSIAYFYGLLKSEKDTYIISDSKWRFIP